jgi:iron complex outermembrane receptor protein
MFARYEILSRKLWFVVLIVISSNIYTQAFAQLQDSNDQYYSEMSIEKLINLDPAKPFMMESSLFETPASFAFLIPEDIRESGYLSIPELLRMAPDVNVPEFDLNEWALIYGASNSLYAEILGLQTLDVPLSPEAYMNIFDISLEDDIEQIQAAPDPEGILSIANVLKGLLWQVDENMDISIVPENLVDTLSTEFSDGFCNENIPATEPKHAIFVKLAWRF